ncbi:hypothetical protein FRC10_002763 [Ceratobasidium sp. 414]|nr:hypothetical protein FRC10_002763 [Ceratobasidium sp. 414]
MSTKSIAVLDASELRDGQMKEVGFGEGKVLLSKLGGKINATSAFCTHYGHGGPMHPRSTGTSGERSPYERWTSRLVRPYIRCWVSIITDLRVLLCSPWHGACFNICTGDIEDAPAPNALHAFKAEVQDGKIVVTADPEKTTKKNISRDPKLAAARAVASEPGVVVVGGGSGGLFAIESLREHGYTGSITLLSKEEYAPIDRTKLSKALITDPSKIEWRTADALRDKYGVTFRPGTVRIPSMTILHPTDLVELLQTVTAIDASAKTVTINGSETIEYLNAVLAPGSIPRTLPVEGADLGNVLTLRTIQDAKAIDAVLQEGKRIVFVGSSFISMELVVVASKRKLASLDVIGMEEVPFERILGKEVGAGLMNFHTKQGVKFHMRSKIAKLSGSGNVSSITFTDASNKDQTIEVDAVIMGTGVRPATDFLKSSNFNLEKDGGVVVNELLQVKGLENAGVYAIGDIAHYPQVPTGELQRVEHWNVANNHGRAVGKTIAGSPQPFNKVPIFWSAQGQQLRYCGIGIGYDDVIIKGNPDEMKFVAYYVKDDKVIAVSSMQNDPVVSKSSELMRLKLMPSPSEIRAGKNPLEIDISSTKGLDAS